MPPHLPRCRARAPRAGMALVLVMAVIALASVLGYAMLDQAAVRTRVYGNAVRSAQADALAESGVNLALYYLQRPAYASGGGSFWAGTGGDLALPGAPGTVNVTVRQDLTGDGFDGLTYEVVSVGKVGIAAQAAQVTRTAQARARVNRMIVRHAAAFGGNVTLPANMTIDGDAYTNGNYGGLNVLASISGKGYYRSGSAPTGKAPAYGWSKIDFSSTTAVPPANGVVNYYTSYQYAGVTYAVAQQTPPATLANVTLSPPAAGNPANVIVYNGALTLGDNVTITGTLVVKGKLTINGTNITVTAVPGFPAAVVKDQFQMNYPSIIQPARTATFNGVVYVGDKIQASGLTLNVPRLAINGALLSTSGPQTGLAATIAVKLEPGRLRVPDLNTSITTPQSVSVVRWGPP